MKKKLTALILAVIMAFGCVSPAAAVIPGEDQAGTAGLYLETAPVPAAAVIYAQNSIGGMLRHSYDLSEITVGTPFVLEGHDCDLYYFLVYHRNVLVGTYRVYEPESGVYTGIYEEDSDWTGNLTQLAARTSPAAPARLVVGSYEDVYAVVSHTAYTVGTDYQDRTTATSAVLTAAAAADAAVTVNAAVGIDFVTPTSTGVSSRFLATPINENQTGGSWCAAYVTAAICSFLTGTTILAENVMVWAYGSGVSSAQTLSREKAIAYGKSKGYSPKELGYAITFSQVRGEINSNRPVYLAFAPSTNMNGIGHALLCRGYSTNEDSSGVSDPIYSVWNPYHSSYSTISATTNTYTSSGGTLYRLRNAIWKWGP